MNDVNGPEPEAPNGARKRQSRAATVRQEPADPDEVFSALITRLITSNEAERATRLKGRGPKQPPARNGHGAP